MEIVNTIIYCMFPALPLIILILIKMPMSNKKILSYSQRDRENVQSIYWKPSGLFGFMISILFILISFLFLANFNANFVSYIEGMIKKIEVINDIILNLTVSALTVAAGMVLLKKDYYLVFSIYDILEEYNFFYWLAGVILSCIFASGIVMTLLDSQLTTMFDLVRFMLFEISILYNFLSIAIVFYIAFKVMFSNDMRHLKLLNKLYRVHEIEKIDYSQMEEDEKWSKKAVKINLEYLLDKYKRDCKNININNIKRVDYISTLKEEKWYKKARKRYIVLVILLYLSSLLMSITNSKETWIWGIAIQTCFLAIDIYIAFSKKPSIKSYILSIFWDVRGFCIKEIKNDAEEIEHFASNYSLWLCNKNYLKYIQSYNSLTAFIKVALEKGVDKKQIEEIIEKYSMQYCVQKSNIVETIPYFIIGYILFKENKKMKCIKTLYKSFELEERERFDFQTMLCSHIFYLEKVENIGYLEGEKGRYIKWLCYNKIKK